MTATLTELRHRLYRMCSFLTPMPPLILGTADTVGSVAAGTVTYTQRLQNTNWNAETLRGLWIFRPTVVAADRERQVASIAPSTGVVTQSGLNYTDTTIKLVEWMSGIRPSELFNLLLAAMEEQPMIHLTPLTSIPTASDPIFETTTTTNWTGANSTLSKITTAAQLPGDTLRGLRVLLTADGGYAQSPTLRGTAGNSVRADVTVRADVGTAELVAYDVTNTVEFGTASTYAGERSAHLWNVSTLPSGCEEYAWRIGGVLDTADTYWANPSFVNLSADYNFFAPSFLDDEFRFRKLRQALYRHPIASNSNADDYFSRDFQDWDLFTDFHLIAQHQVANPYMIQLRRNLPSAQMFIESLRKASDFTTFTDDATGEALTTTAPVNQLVARWAIKVCQWFRDKGDLRPEIVSSWSNAYGILKRETEARPVESVAHHDDMSGMFQRI